MKFKVITLVNPFPTHSTVPYVAFLPTVPGPVGHGGSRAEAVTDLREKLTRCLGQWPEERILSRRDLTDEIAEFEA